MSNWEGMTQEEIQESIRNLEDKIIALFKSGSATDAQWHEMAETVRYYHEANSNCTRIYTAIGELE